MLVAWRNKDSTTYRVESDRVGASETYNARERLKRCGARWDGKHWNVTNDQRELLNIPRIFWVEVTPCHEFMNISFCSEDEAIEGLKIDCFCGMCDSHYFAKILKVFGDEYPYARKDEIIKEFQETKNQSVR